MKIANGFANGKGRGRFQFFSRRVAQTIDKRFHGGLRFLAHPQHTSGSLTGREGTQERGKRCSGAMVAGDAALAIDDVVDHYRNVSSATRSMQIRAPFQPTTNAALLDLAPSLTSSVPISPHDSALSGPDTVLTFSTSLSWQLCDSTRQANKHRNNKHANTKESKQRRQKLNVCFVSMGYLINILILIKVKINYKNNN